MRPYLQSRRAVGVFCALAAALYLLAFALNRDYWPFVSFDMYTEFNPRLLRTYSFEGSLPNGKTVEISPLEYFSFRKRYDFSMLLGNLHSQQSPRIGSIIETLKARYNERAQAGGKQQLRRLRVFVSLWELSSTSLSEKKFLQKQLWVER